MLVAELNHRVRNILALIRGLISQTGSSAETAEGFIATLDERVQSLARAHNQITSDRWGPARLIDLIATEAGAYLARNPDCVRGTGPNVLIQPAAFTTLALVVHELMTNAAKYGALSEAGAVLIDWRLDSGGDLLIDWAEHGGPPVAQPSRRGFGTTIIEQSIPYDLGGSAAVEYAAAGLKARFSVPSRHIAGLSTVDVGGERSLPVLIDRQLLGGLGVLVVEDSMIIALDCANTLRSLGAAHVTTAASVAEALTAIDARTFDVALLDFNLGEETSIVVADALAARNIPFAFATGYDGHLQNRGHPAAPVIGKPYGTTQLGPLLAKLGFGQGRRVALVDQGKDQSDALGVANALAR